MIFNDAANLNMTVAGYVWIVTEQALDASNAPDGLLGLKLINATQEKSHITDSLSVYLLVQPIASAFSLPKINPFLNLFRLRISFAS